MYVAKKFEQQSKIKATMKIPEAFFPNFWNVEKIRQKVSAGKAKIMTDCSATLIARNKRNMGNGKTSPPISASTTREIRTNEIFLCIPTKS
jgi:hypothetical protein